MFFLQDVPGAAMNREVSMMFEAQDILIFRTNSAKIATPDLIIAA
jgi:hypothetical protein